MHTHTSRILSSLSQDGTDPWNIPKVIIIFFSSSLGHGPCACRNGFLSPFWWILRYVAHVTLQGKAHCSSCCCQPLVIASATELPCRSHATFWGGLYLMADRCGSLMSWASRPILGQFWMAIPAQTTPPPRVQERVLMSLNYSSYSPTPNFPTPFNKRWSQGHSLSSILLTKLYHRIHLPKNSMWDNAVFIPQSL